MIEVHQALPADSPVARELYHFRYRVFVQHAGWQLHCQQQLERDQFDTDVTVHLVSRAANGRIAGLLRLLPTTAPYMIEKLWADLLGPFPPPRSPKTWEVSRLGTDPELGPHERGQSVAELVAACLEYGLDHGIHQMLAVMSEDHARRVVMGMGWSYERCGPARLLGGVPVIALRLRLSEDALASVRLRTRQPHRLCPEASSMRAQPAHAQPA
ncbi:GNAT family N-acetyltransferase [Mitsuaria sp. WAJ17]|uniref:acyl-homoserine-lactone synthase n=1 Tax=Mitsuaria sp. WAJ17 TaxID=2761452 RepID=UPI0016021D07|nr:acyl-homoserine-lactone synthase [Mitsuaria sp. WAJ17]MBB2484027.1 GNAT family N-acetyltransferase [Mitsuaria sp. WAJ17]